MFFLIFIAGILYALFDIFVAKSAGRINDLAANVIFNGLGALIPLLIIGLLVGTGRSIHMEKQGVMWSVLAGLAIAAFSVLLVKIFANGGNLSYVIPAIYGIVIVVSTLVGWIIFKDHFSLLALLGVILITAGIAALSFAKA
jgi:uncharacterized membrane protein